MQHWSIFFKIQLFKKFKMCQFSSTSCLKLTVGISWKWETQVLNKTKFVSFLISPDNYEFYIVCSNQTTQTFTKLKTRIISEIWNTREKTIAWLTLARNVSMLSEVRGFGVGIGKFSLGVRFLLSTESLRFPTQGVSSAGLIVLSKVLFCWFSSRSLALISVSLSLVL